MPLWFTLPMSFQPEEHLPPRLMMKADEARWLVSTIVQKSAYRQTDTHDWVRLHWDILRQVMNHHTLRDVVEALVQGGVLETSSPQRGKRSTGYRLTGRYLADRHVRRQAMDVRLCQKIEQQNNRLRKDAPPRKPIHDALANEQQHIGIVPEADRVLQQLPDHTRLCQDVLVANIRQRAYPFTVSSTGRVFNAITGLKREVRPTLRLDQKPVGSVDIRCAQPALFALMIGRKTPSAELNGWDTYKHWSGAVPCLDPPPVPGGSVGGSADGRLFCELARSGSLYEFLAERTGFSREKVKERFLIDVLAKRGGYPSDMEEAFRDAFPSVHQTIRAINHENHGTLVRRLQRMESWLVIDHVAPRLVGAFPFLTLHDAIYCRSHDVPQVVEAFEEVFDELDFSLALKAEAGETSEALVASL